MFVVVALSSHCLDDKAQSRRNARVDVLTYGIPGPYKLEDIHRDFFLLAHIFVRHDSMRSETIGQLVKQKGGWVVEIGVVGEEGGN